MGLGTVQTVRDLKNTELVRGSPYTVSASGGYTWLFSGGDSLTGHLGWAHRGRFFSTLESLPTSKQEAFGLLDGRITWALRGGNASLSVWGRNLLDKAYITGALDFSGGTAPSHYVTHYWGEPQRFGLEWSYSFGQP